MSMQFSDTTTKNGLVQDCEINLFGDSGYTQITGNSNRLATFTNFLNRALDKVSILIMSSDGRWQYDDTNFTDLPIGTTTLVNTQQQYQLSTSQLNILRVEIMGSDGKYYKINPIDLNEIQGTSMSEFMNSAGSPVYYDLLGDSIFLYPKPQTGYVTMALGMKIYFQREPSYFVSTDTTKLPGVNGMFHRLISRIACLDYAIARQLPQKNDIQSEITLMEAQLQDFYAKRNLDDAVGFRTKAINWN